MVATGTDGMTPPASDFPALLDEIRHLRDDVGLPMPGRRACARWSSR